MSIMHEDLVINTGPVIALIAGQGDLSSLRLLYRNVIVPREVAEEILSRGSSRLGAKEFIDDDWIQKISESIQTVPYLANTLDKGEASVIQTALNEKIKTVCIDEAVGRRIARLNGLKIIGSLGIMILAKKKGADIDIETAIQRMRRHGIWIVRELEQKAIELSS